ncbi:MAG: hypothetical protein J6U73_07870 [Alistipes sp.]|nr:hypothetical protein [Alistipes sp.]
MAKTDNLTDYLTDLADAIRAKKGITEKINPQDFASEIASIEIGSNKHMLVPYLRRTGDGYIDTGIKGANNNLTIKVRYAMRVFPTGYWRFISAYKDESTNTTRIILNKNTQLLANLNAVATGGSITLTRTGYTGVVYTDILEPTSSTAFKLTSNGVSTTKTRTLGEPIDQNILIFPLTTDTVDVELYQCQIYDGDTLVRDFYPWYEEEFGLYDLVSKTFFKNNGTGTFTGELIEI